jgi:hypothetical protein
LLRGRHCGPFACSRGRQPRRTIAGACRVIVTDATSAVIPGATVTLLNSNTGVETVRQTNANGQYLFDFVEPGTYQVSAEAPGFGTLRAAEHHRSGARRRHRQSGPARGRRRRDDHGRGVGSRNSVQHVDHVAHGRPEDAHRSAGAGAEPLHARAPRSSRRQPLYLESGDSQPFFMWSSSSDGRRRQHVNQERPAAGRRAAATQPEGLLRSAHGRGPGIHRAAERGGRRVRPLGRRHHEPVDEVRHQRVSRHRILSWAATRR